MGVANRARRAFEAGVTLVELMIVVAIIGILASGATYMYSKSQAKAKAKEIPLMFAEFKAKQEQYYLQNDTYLSTGNDSTKWPTAPSGTRNTNSLAPLPWQWSSLRISPDKSSVHCAYVTVAGDAYDDSNIGTTANAFGLTAAPATDWYYIIAECNWDNDSSLNSFYFTTNQTEEIFEQNKGR